MEITPWVKEFVEKFSNEERMKKYLSERPESSSYGIWLASRNMWFFLSLQYNITLLEASGTFVRDIEVELWFSIWNVDNHSFSAFYVYMHSWSLQDGIVISIWV